jgi:hypothetical protein
LGARRKGGNAERQAANDASAKLRQHCFSWARLLHCLCGTAHILHGAGAIHRARKLVSILPNKWKRLHGACRSRADWLSLDNIFTHRKARFFPWRHAFAKSSHTLWVCHTARRGNVLLISSLNVANYNALLCPSISACCIVAFYTVKCISKAVSLDFNARSIR